MEEAQAVRCHCRREAPRPETAGELPPGLLEACRKGDREALGVLFDRYRDFVYSLAAHLTRDRSLAADVTQEVFLKLLTRIAQFRGEARFTSWLARIVINTVWDQKRAARGALPIPDDRELATLVAASSPEEDAGRKEASLVVRRAVARLSRKLRTPVVLRYVGGLSYEEISEVLRVSTGTVASRLSRALRALAKTMASFSGEGE
jgi:RNA polymerase sigma-70 factor, ECF subfamily